MRASMMLLLGASSVSAVPLFLRSPSTLISTISTRDSTDDNNNNDKVPLAGIIIGSIFGTALVICLIAYLVSHDNCITRRGWFKRRRENKKNKGKSQLLNPQEDEEALTKRASFASERESIMFSRSRASSLNFAVVQDVDHSQRRMSSQVYVLRDGKYVPVDQTEAEQRKGLLSGDGNEMAEVDIASSSMDRSERASLTSIPVIISPPLENTQTEQHHDYMTRTGHSDRSDAGSDASTYQGILPDDPRTHA